MDKVTLGQVYLRVMRFLPVDIVPSVLHTHTSPGGQTTGPLVVAVQRQSRPLDMNNNRNNLSPLWLDKIFIPVQTSTVTVQH
jgi:hypothetical protein